MTYCNATRNAAVTSPQVDDMPRPFDALETSQRLAIVSATVFTIAAGITTATGASDVARFILSALAIAALAAAVGQAIEQVSRHLSPGATGVLQSSLGNLPELLVAIFALRAGLTSVVQSALVGSVLANVLLVLGVAFLSGGARYGVQAFRPEGPRMLVTLLTLAVGALLVPTLAAHLETPAAHHTNVLSDVTAAILFVVYVASIPFWLSRSPDKGQQAGPAAAGGQLTPPAGAAQARPAGTTSNEMAETHRRWHLRTAVVVLVIAAAASAAVSDWFVASLLPATVALGITPEFTGLVIVAIASNAVENYAGVRFAWRARSDYAVSTILNSPLQIALLLTPVLVLASNFFGPHHLTLVLPPLLVAALAVAVVVTAVVVYDGEYSWLEGVALIALYAIVATAFWWG
jgi:Ca2+:H+ antiporter